MWLRRDWLLLSGLALLAVQPAAFAGDKTETPPVTQWVARLGSPDFKERTEATRALDALGAPALEALRQAAASDDAEVRRRAHDLVDRILVRLDSARLVEPKKVHLVYQDVPLRDAVADFARQTGYAIELATPTGPAGDRKVTLDTGTVTFWEAFDEFCRKAGVVEPLLLPAPANQGVNPGTAEEQQIRMLQQQAMFMRGMRRGGYGYAVPQVDTSKIVLAEGQLPELPTCEGTALRVRLLPKHVPVTANNSGENEKVVPLEVTPEPGLAWMGLVSLAVTHAVDERGQTLTQPDLFLADNSAAFGPYNDVMIWNGNAQYYGGAGVQNPNHPNHVPVRLVQGARTARTLKELSGVVTAQVMTPVERLLWVDDVTKNVGRAVPGPHGGSLKVVDLDQKDGQVKVRLQLDTPAEDDGAPPANVNARAWRINKAVWAMRGGMMQDNPGEPLALELIDAKGQAFQRANPEDARRNPNGGMQEFVVTYNARAGQAEPVKLVYSGRRSVTVEVPFTLKDVPLP
jgi:hypothetical protein